MKMLLSTVLLFWASIDAVAESQPAARVLRLFCNTNTWEWRLAVNDTNFNRPIASKDMTNELLRLRLHFGDLLVFGCLPLDSKTPGGKVLDWLRIQCASNQVAAYFYTLDDQPPGNAIFTTPVYHWVAPFSDPRDFAAARFFREGKYLGISTNGFEATLNDIRVTHPKEALVLGSLHDFEPSAPILLTPFESQWARFDKELRAAGTYPIQLDPMLGWRDAC